MEIEVGKRYQKVNGKYVENPMGQHLGKKGPFGKVGLLDLGIKTQLGFPIDKKTGGPYEYEPDYNTPQVGVAKTVELCSTCGRSKEPCKCK
jgi:hypothetical protein